MQRVLVAGATGYLGRFVVREFNRRGYWVRALARNSKKLILAKYRVPEEIRRERRRRNSKISKDREMTTYRTNEAAKLLNL